jgi:IS30 family transposase
MYLSSSSAAGIRFLVSVKHGHGLKPSARQAGIDKEVGYGTLVRRGRAATRPSVLLQFLGEHHDDAAGTADVGELVDVLVRCHTA